MALEDFFRIAQKKCARCNHRVYLGGLLQVGTIYKVWCPECLIQAFVEEVPVNPIKATCKRCDKETWLYYNVFWEDLNQCWCAECGEEVLREQHKKGYVLL